MHFFLAVYILIDVVSTGETK